MTSARHAQLLALLLLLPGAAGADGPAPAAAPAVAPAHPAIKAHLHQAFGHTGAGTPDAPSVRWSGHTLQVTAVADVTASTRIRNAVTGVDLDGDELVLGYCKEPVPKAPGQMAPHWAAPVLMSISVTGLPKKDYKVRLELRCP